MNSILSEIAKLREGRPISIDYKNTNRYRILVRETDATTTAYYFSAPIYNKETRKLLELRFHSNAQGIASTGSNAKITISDAIYMENDQGSCRLDIATTFVPISDKEIACGTGRLFPTTNGVAYLAHVKEGGVEMTVQVSSPFWTVRANDQCFALMQEDFRPFVTISAIGTAGLEQEVIAPARIDYQKQTDQTYELTLTPLSPMGTYVLLEANLHEPKLFQDTTVESKNPKANNAFGTVAFVGDTAALGEQWLYSRLDYSIIPELTGRRIEKATLHFPRYGHSYVSLKAFQIFSRFCSFGSNWENKVPAASVLSDSILREGHQSLDITGLLTNPKTGFFHRSEGLILRPGTKGSGFSAVATGDSCFAPPILEINFR